MKIRTILLVAAMLLAFSTVAFTYQTQRTLWEYTETCKFADANRLGAEGWELVAVTADGAVQCFYYKRTR